MVQCCLCSKPRPAPAAFLGENSRRGEFFLGGRLGQAFLGASPELRLGSDGAWLRWPLGYSVDPIGYSGGINLYEYCSDSPAIYVDPFGTDDCHDKYIKAISAATDTLFADFKNDKAAYNTSVQIATNNYWAEAQKCHNTAQTALINIWHTWDVALAGCTLWLIPNPYKAVTCLAAADSVAFEASQKVVLDCQTCYANANVTRNNDIANAAIVRNAADAAARRRANAAIAAALAEFNECEKAKAPKPVQQGLGYGCSE